MTRVYVPTAIATACSFKHLCRLAAAAIALATLPTCAWSQQPGQAPATADAPQSFATTETISSGMPAASPNLEQRVRELEAIIKQMQLQKDQGFVAPAADSSQDPGLPPLPGIAPQDDRLPPPRAPVFNPIGTEGQANPPLSETPGGPFAGWRNNGIFIESADKNFLFRITGQVQADYREFLRTKDRTDIDTFLLRRARLGIEATVFKYYDFRFLPDYGQGTSIIQDAYMNVRYWNEVQFEIGRFKQPISYEQLIQDRYVPTLERSIIDQLVPQRDLGAMIHGEDVFANRLDYAVSISNGEINGNSTDLNNHKDVDGRIAVRPLNDPDNWEWLRYFGVGVSGGFGIEQEPINPATLRTPDTVPFFAFNSTVRADGLRTRLCPELTYFYGPLGFVAEYYEQHQDMRPAAGSHFLEDVPFRGYVLLGSCFLTGETRTTYSQHIFPLRNFDPRHPCSCPGAWELVARVSHLDVGDIVYSPGAAALANPATSANVATEYTLGFNWYFNGFVRMQFNYEHDMFNRSVLLGPSVANDELRSQDSLFTRFQIIF